MDRNNIVVRVFQFSIVSCLSLALIVPLGVTSVSYAQEVEEQLEDEITSRGVRGKVPPSRSRVMKKAMPLTKSPLASGNQQILRLRQQVNALQAQVNALRSVIQVSNGVATVQAKVIRLQGDSVTVKSLKDGVTIESKKNLKIESKRDLTVKATSKMDIHAGSNLDLKGNGVTNIRGSLIKLNNGGHAVLSTGSVITTAPVVGGAAATSGSPTVFVP